jgi:hypothetical protein
MLVSTELGSACISAVYKGDALPIVGSAPAQYARLALAQAQALTVNGWLAVAGVVVGVVLAYRWGWRPLVYTRKLHVRFACFFV